MSDSQENIEARLCDYIEGELDSAGRAEIEQHLDATPEHRELIVFRYGRRTVQLNDKLVAYIRIERNRG